MASVFFFYHRSTLSHCFFYFIFFYPCFSSPVALYQHGLGFFFFFVNSIFLRRILFLKVQYTSRLMTRTLCAPIIPFTSVSLTFTWVSLCDTPCSLCDHIPLAFLSLFCFLFYFCPQPRSPCLYSSISTSASPPMTCTPPTLLSILSPFSHHCFPSLLSLRQIVSRFASIHPSPCLWWWDVEMKGRETNTSEGGGVFWGEEETHSVRDFALGRWGEESVGFPAFSPPLSPLSAQPRCEHVCRCVRVSPSAAAVRRRYRWAGKRR